VHPDDAREKCSAREIERALAIGDFVLARGVHAGDFACSQSDSLIFAGWRACSINDADVQEQDRCLRSVIAHKLLHLRRGPGTVTLLAICEDRGQQEKPDERSRNERQDTPHLLGEHDLVVRHNERAPARLVTKL